MKKLSLWCLVSFALVSVTGCAVTAKIPMNRFESPEVNGGWLKGEGQIAYQGRGEVEFTPSYLTRSPSVTDPSVEAPGHRLMANGALGLLDRLDVNLTLPQARLGAKVQVLGNPRITAEKGNTSLAVSVGVSGTKEKDSTTNYLTTTAGPSYELKETQIDFALIGGWRPSKDVLIYGGPFLLFDLVDTTYTPPGGASVAQEGEIRAQGVNLGVQGIFDKIFIRGEIAGSMIRLGRANVGRGTYGASAGMYF